jgi:hypothetical protein
MAVRDLPLRLGRPPPAERGEVGSDATGNGVAGLRDLSTRPCRSRRGTSKERIMEIERLRRQRWTGARIAHQLGLSAATLGRVPRRLGLNRAGDLEPLLPPNRYEHLAAGDLLHLDIKRLVHPGAFAPSDRQPRGRRQGHRGRVHACCHRSPLAARLCCHVSGPGERSFTHFLAIAVPWYEGLGIGIRRVLTDNDQCYKANRFAHARGQVGLKHRRTRPYTHAPTVKQNASSRPPATSGPTHAPSRTQQKEAPSFRLGPISTTGIDPTPASTDNHPSAEQGSMTTTS